MLKQTDKTVVMTCAILLEDFDTKTDEEIRASLKDFLKKQTEKEFSDNELMDCVKGARFRIAVARENKVRETQ